MKHWKALLIALVVLVLTFACTAALAEAKTEKPSSFEKDQSTCGHGDYDWYIKKAPTCTKAGTETQYCTKCGKDIYSRDIAATGHSFTKDRQTIDEAECTTAGKKVWKCQNPDCTATKEEVIPAKGHNVLGVEWSKKTNEGAVAPTCKEDGKEVRICTVCHKVGETRTVPKTTNHSWNLIDPEVSATCTENGKKDVFECSVCGAKKGGEVIKALGHKWGKAEVTAATCTKDGLSVKTCERVVNGVKCTATDKTVLKATGHKKAWRVTVKATPTSDGVKEQYCKTCGQVFDTRVDPYTKMLYQNNVTGFGPRTKELIGGKTWERITPIDLSVEGKKTYDLVASDAYVVGTATVEIAEGKLTVTYSTVKCVDVRKENLTIYANTAALADPTEDTAKTFKYGEAIDIAENFGEDNIVLLGIHLIADYDQIGDGVTPFRPAQSDIDALKALAD